MIRVLYMSDLHLEMERWRISIPGWKDFMARHRLAPRHPMRGPMLDQVGRVDLVVLAGDIHNGLRSVVYGEQVADYLGVPVVLVAGNHEYYHQHMDLLEPALRSSAVHTGGRVHFLENDTVTFTLGGRRLHVLGSTLWTDYTLYGDVEEGMAFAAAHMNDHRLIHRVSSLFTPSYALERHRRARAWLHEEIARLRAAEPDAAMLVVTHHAPSAAYLGRRTGGIAPAYASELLGEFSGYGLDAWIHGHTHYRHESEEAGIKVVSAPRGYVSHEGAKVMNYKPGIVEI